MNRQDLVKVALRNKVPNVNLMSCDELATILRDGGVRVSHIAYCPEHSLLGRGEVCKVALAAKDRLKHPVVPVSKKLQWIEADKQIREAITRSECGDEGGKVFFVSVIDGKIFTGKKEHPGCVKCNVERFKCISRAVDIHALPHPECLLDIIEEVNISHAREIAAMERTSIKPIKENVMDTNLKLQKDQELKEEMAKLAAAPKPYLSDDDINNLMSKAYDNNDYDVIDLMEPTFTAPPVVPVVPVLPTTKGAQTMSKHKINPKSMPFRPMLGGIQLQPQTEPVDGLIVYPVFNEKSEVIDITAKSGKIEIAEASSFRSIPGMKYVTFASEDAGVKAQMLWRYLRAVTEQDILDGLSGDDLRIPVGNIKKSDCIIGVLAKRDWDTFFGCDVRAINLWKVILPVMTPTGVEIRNEYSNITTIRLRVLNSLVTATGYPAHDGDIVTKVWMEFYKHSDLDKDNLPVTGAKTKKINRNWQARADGFTVKGDRMPELKAKMYADDKEYMKMCSENNVDPDAQDGFVTKDNLKTLKHLYSHMDILEFPITNLRNVKTKMKDWSSSMGAQCIALADHSRTKEVLNGHGILERADIIKGAAELQLEAIIRVMESDQEARWDDALSMPVKCMFARYDKNNWFVPRMNKDTFYTRLESFYKDYGIKIQIDKDGYYIQGDGSLDVAEDAQEVKSGRLQYYVYLPKTAKFIDKIKVGDKIDLGRDPFVGPSNFMTFIVAGFNDSHDCITFSWQSIYAMYGDVDGDTAKYETLVANTSSHMYPCLRRPSPGLKAEKPFPTVLPTMEQYFADHESIGLSVLKSAADTGSLDLTTRQIIEERMYADVPMTNDELMVLSQLRQDAIDGLKHTEAGVALDAKEDIIKTYGVNGKMAKLKESPITYRLLRKDAGVGRKGDVGRFIERIKLINECAPHATHPYRDFFMTLKGIQTIEKNSEIADAEWLQKQCTSIWLEVCHNHKTPRIYSWGINDVVKLGTWLSKNHSNEAIKYLSYDEDARKAAFTALKEYHRSLVSLQCRNLFWGAPIAATGYTQEEIDFYTNEPSVAHSSVRYCRQMTMFLGTRGFGVGHKQISMPDGNTYPEAYGKGGGAMWNMMEEYTIFLAEEINIRAVARGEFPSMNPFMDKIKEALSRNREKAAQKALLNI